MTNGPQELMAPLRETAAQTAWRVRRRLKARWPTQQFLVRADALSQTITVSWSAGPTESEVDAITRSHCRHRAPAGGVIWATDTGVICIVESLATVRLRRGDYGF